VCLLLIWLVGRAKSGRMMMRRTFSSKGYDA
jgi:hypothetical protein